MVLSMDLEFWGRVLAIIVIDLMLAGDNALVIALAVRSLPRRQQRWGIIWGAIGAVGLRLALITVATLMLRISFLQLAGGVLLLWIAIKLVRQTVDAGKEVRQGISLWSAIWIIIAADAVMSLDNVLGVAGAARGDLRLVIFGVGLSLPLVVWGSGILARLMDRFEWIMWLGGGLIGYVAGEMILADQAVHRWLGRDMAAFDVLFSLGLAIVVVALGWWSGRARRAEIPRSALKRTSQGSSLVHTKLSTDPENPEHAPLEDRGSGGGRR